jgi:hypothetical protein
MYDVEDVVITLFTKEISDAGNAAIRTQKHESTIG